MCHRYFKNVGHHHPGTDLVGICTALLSSCPQNGQKYFLAHLTVFSVAFLFAQRILCFCRRMLDLLRLFAVRSLQSS